MSELEHLLEELSCFNPECSLEVSCRECRRKVVLAIKALLLNELEKLRQQYDMLDMVEERRKVIHNQAISEMLKVLDKVFK